NWFALLAVWLVTLAIFTTVLDTYRTVTLRASNRQEPVRQAFGTLVRRFSRRYGGYLIHIGVALMALGIIGIEFFQTTTQGMLAAGETLSLSGYTFTYEKLEVTDNADGRNSARASVMIKRDNRELKRVFPGSDTYYVSQQSVTLPGVRSTLVDDLYVILVDWQPISSEGATFKIYRNPLINWLWIGSGVLVFGTLVALWPTTRRKNIPRTHQEEK
ncbi:MAG: hypothetical protein KBA59_04970, partial [Anaerolineaceae bacterium]|nr:hypothetical protein [Anaerolineaceae bacterium]